MDWLPLGLTGATDHWDRTTTTTTDCKILSYHLWAIVPYVIYTIHPAARPSSPGQSTTSEIVEWRSTALNTHLSFGCRTMTSPSTKKRGFGYVRSLFSQPVATVVAATLTENGFGRSVYQLNRSDHHHMGLPAEWVSILRHTITTDMYFYRPDW